MSTGSRVLILGYGEMGHAMEYLLGPRHTLQFWDVRPLQEHRVEPLEQVVPQAEFVLYCVPVKPLAALAAQVLPLLSADSVSLAIAKGLDENGQPAPAVLAGAYAGARHFGVMYGPMISEEIRAGKPAYAQLAASMPDCLPRIQQLFQDSNLRLEDSDDMTGMAWCALLKNVYAMLIGVADELQLGDNVRGFLVVAAIREMQAIVQSRGGQVVTTLQLAGLGDLVTTATSAGSHHHELGRQLARGASELAGEGVHTLAMLQQRVPAGFPYSPLLELVGRMLQNPVAAAALLRSFLGVRA